MQTCQAEANSVLYSAHRGGVPGVLIEKSKPLEPLKFGQTKVRDSKLSSLVNLWIGTPHWCKSSHTVSINYQPTSHTSKATEESTIDKNQEICESDKSEPKLQSLRQFEDNIIMALGDSLFLHCESGTIQYFPATLKLTTTLGVYKLHTLCICRGARQIAVITADKFSSNITTDIRMRLTNCTVAKEKFYTHPLVQVLLQGVHTQKSLPIVLYRSEQLVAACTCFPNCQSWPTCEVRHPHGRSRINAKHSQDPAYIVN